MVIGALKSVFSMLVGEEEGDVVMEDKIEVTVHVIGIFRSLNLSPIYSSECASTRLFLCSNIPRRLKR